MTTADEDNQGTKSMKAYEAVDLIERLLDASWAYEHANSGDQDAAIRTQSAFLTVRKEVLAALMRPTENK